jgi:hypothetical protein
MCPSVHISVAVNGMDKAKEQLNAHSIPLAVGAVPGWTSKTQLCMYVPSDKK